MGSAGRRLALGFVILVLLASGLGLYLALSRPEPPVRAFLVAGIPYIWPAGKQTS